jgi:hypothetical protein
MIRLTDWVFAFVHGYRYESNKLDPEETKCFVPFVQENLLSMPGQMEVVVFNKPFRIVLLYFLDKTKLDLLIRIQQRKWTDIITLTKQLQEKHCSLQLKREELAKLLQRCRCNSKKSLFAIDFARNVFAICFNHDPRVKVSPYPWELSYINGPQEMAELIFHLNIDQASCYFNKNGY